MFRMHHLKMLKWQYSKDIVRMDEPLVKKTDQDISILKRQVTI